KHETHKFAELGTDTGRFRDPQGASSADLNVLTLANTCARSGWGKPQGNLYDQRWNDRYRELKNFEAKYGHCNDPQGQGSWEMGERPTPGTKERQTV
ncbi:hypothetical protein THAOC_32581, partial [Thalassiosira oceanica]